MDDDDPKTFLERLGDGGSAPFVRAPSGGKTESKDGVRLAERDQGTASERGKARLVVA